MRILFLTPYFAPETGAAQNRVSDLARRLVELGNSVTVLTAMPNYPQGKILRHFRGRVVHEATEEGVRVLRTWIYATKSKRFPLRMLNYISFSMMAVMLGLWKVGRHDFVIVESPPLFLGLSGLLISRSKHAGFVMNISDLWPESVVALGILQEGFLLRLATRLEEYLYRKSVFVTGQTEGIVESINERFPKKLVALQPNGICRECLLEEGQRGEARRRIRQEFAFDGQFVAGYAGLHGLAQGLETVLGAAELLRDVHPIRFAFFGDGPDKERLMYLAEERGLPNVHFYASQSGARMPEILAALDTAIIPLRKHVLFRGALPSKLFESMGAGLPTVVSIQGEAQALVESAQAGLCIEPENPRAMAEAILKLYRDSHLRNVLGENGRRYVIQHFDRAEIAERLNRLLTAAKAC